MGEGTLVIGQQTNGDRRPAPAVIEQEIRGLRGELEHLIGELDRRRHELLDVRLQVKRHAVPVSLAALALVLASAGTVAFSVWRGRRRQSLMAKAGRLGEAVSRAIERPDRVAVEPTATARIVAAAGSAVAAMVIKGALEHLRHRLEARAHAGEHRPQGPIALRPEAW